MSASRGSLRREEELINAFEADQERITLTLSRKLEQLRSEKVQLENTLEAESESQVLRLSRQLTALRQAQQQQQQQQSTQGEASTSGAGTSTLPPTSNRSALSTSRSIPIVDPRYPDPDAILEALRRENESLRRRVNEMERDYVRVTRLNDIYREELIEHRRRLGLSVDSLIGLTGPSITNSPAESLSQPIHRRPQAVNHPNLSSTTSSVASSPDYNPSLPNRATGATPIPIHRDNGNRTVASTAMRPLPIHRTNGHTPLRHSASSSTSTTSSATNSPSSSLPSSPFTFSPPNLRTPDLESYNTHATTPPSSNSPLPLQAFVFQPLGAPQLSYPSVPPPSLSSSVGSPGISVSLSPSISRRNSVGQGNAPNTSNNAAVGRRVSVERGARIAETGSLAGRRRGGGASIGE
ncbi:uncharacterized protein EI90DRAFT_3145930 [Cantharellus anzutake]|uniref:uncharacterized protein n=1 Tax=Cantharellus anzutake TaxID=1750568 RepID=UPI0019046A1F|nr:uncharacterized protein EI90DRAFT_3145930 [Cantharellus anzutake]KAF8329427.1 hypothetical protein EI90DRAFT_3145930 [Cantharellus anzutake]